jgi:hypothetical protein
MFGAELGQVRAAAGRFLEPDHGQPRLRVALAALDTVMLSRSLPVRPERAPSCP